jgi:sec-independent protein translocase protein TatA
MGRNFLDNPLLLIILVLIIVLIFGANRLPGAARSLGRSMRIFKSEVKELKDDDKSAPADGTGTGAGDSAPLEGRVVDPSEPTQSQRSRDTQRDA